MGYELEEHRHRFAMWAAARAAQRGFTTVGKLRDALQASRVRDFLKTCDFEAVDAATFNALHREWCQAVMASLTNAGVKDVAFGRAAKLVGIYLKSVVVLGAGCGSRFSKVAHPPIDAILLSAAARAQDIVSDHKAEWSKVRWTNLDEVGYSRLIEQLRAALPPDEPFWKLEQFWTVTDQEESA